MAFSLALGVTPEILKDQAGKLTASIEKMCTDYQNLENLMDGTAGYWYGEAGNKYRQNFDDQKETIAALETQMKTYPTRILRMAGIYIKAEEINTQQAGALGNDLHLV